MRSSRRQLNEIGLVAAFDRVDRVEHRDLRDRDDPLAGRGRHSRRHERDGILIPVRDHVGERGRLLVCRLGARRNRPLLAVRQPAAGAHMPGSALILVAVLPGAAAGLNPGLALLFGPAPGQRAGKRRDGETGRRDAESPHLPSTPIGIMNCSGRAAESGEFMKYGLQPSHQRRL
jgi:hypothetical protein